MFVVPAAVYVNFVDSGVECFFPVVCFNCDSMGDLVNDGDFPLLWFEGTLGFLEEVIPTFGIEIGKLNTCVVDDLVHVLELFLGWHFVIEVGFNKLFF